VGSLKVKYRERKGKIDRNKNGGKWWKFEIIWGC